MFKHVRNLSVAALTVGLLAGASGAAFADTSQASVKLPYLQNIDLNLGHGQNIDRFNLFDSYGANIDLTTVRFGGGLNETTIDGYGTFTNHFDENGFYVGTTYTDDPDVDAAGATTLTVFFGANHSFEPQPKGASSSNVMGYLRLNLDDDAVQVPPPHEPFVPDPVTVITAPEVPTEALVPVQEVPDAPESVIEEEAPAAEIPADEVSDEAPVADAVLDVKAETPVDAVNVPEPAVAHTPAAGLAIQTQAPAIDAGEVQKERDVLANTAAESKGTSIVEYILTMAAGVAITLGFVIFGARKNKTASLSQ